ncbi:MAG: 16S rRNA (adenine(1518)-N(6)/adenine(1519)-N(6))-dimethyltransferase RsmA [Candidatus Omnitrophota bacterium]
MSENLKPLKRFGQNFLVDANVVRKIIAACDISRTDYVLEIGSGNGALTLPLAQRAKRVVAVEIDRGRSLALRQKMLGFTNTKIICQDILKFDLKKHISRARSKRLKVIGNLPYYLTTPILEYLLRHLSAIDDIYIMLQKEVAQRLTADRGSKAYSSLTCFVNYFCHPEILFKIKSGSFFPKPKVESCFVHLKPRDKDEYGLRVRSQELLFKVIRHAFGQRRKTLLGSLSRAWPRQELLRLPQRALLERRPEELSLDDFVHLSNHVFDFSRER